MNSEVSEVAQSCPSLCHPMDCSLPGSSIHGIFQAKVLEWVAIYLKKMGKLYFTEIKNVCALKDTIKKVKR